MAINEDVFLQNIAARANAINRVVNNSEPNGVDRRSQSLPSPRDMNSDYDGWSDPTLGISSQFSPVNDIQESYKQPITEDAYARSRMREDIKQSMMNEQIDLSALEKVNANDIEAFMNSNRLDRIRKINNEPASKTVVSQGGLVVDYSLIKDIVNNCLDAKLEAMSGKLNLIMLKGGEIKLVDNKGNIYAAKLEKIGNTNKK